MSKERIAVDARITRRMSVGMARYATELQQRLPLAAPDLDLTFYRNGGNINFTEQFVIPLKSLLERQRFVHFTTNFAPILMPRPYVVTVHDLIFMRYPGLLSQTALQLYSMYCRWVVPNAARVIIQDERTIADLRTFLGVREERCRVIPLGYDTRILAAIPYLPPERPYFLYSGNRSPHKNVETLIGAWRRLPPDVDVDLYLTGPGHTESSTTDGGRRTLHYLGNVPEEQLLSLYRGALAYVHPAFTEGFGLPMLEAMAIGAPVIAAQECVPLILREHAVTFPATDAAALLERLCAIGRNPDAFREKSLQAAAHARNFTWDRCAEETARVYRELL